MKLRKFFIRYYPPGNLFLLNTAYYLNFYKLFLINTGIGFEYRKQRRTKQKILDLFDIEHE